MPKSRAARKLPDSDISCAEQLLSYIDRAEKSAARPRVILVFVILVTVFVFTAAWNSRPSGWSNSRLRIYKTASSWCGKTLSSNASSSERESYDLAQDAYKVLGTWECDYWRFMVQALENNLTENVRMVRVPFFGVSFDVNDLGLVSGISLVVVLVIYRFALWRELFNMRLTIRLAWEMDGAAYNALHSGQIHRNRWSRMCYDLLTMSQVVIVPPSTGSVHPWHWRHVTKSVLACPVLVQAMVLYNDYHTLHVGTLYNKSAAIVSMMLTFSALIPIVVLAVSSLIIWRSIETIWVRRARELGVIPPKDRWLGPGSGEQLGDLPGEGAKSLKGPVVPFAV